MHKHKVGIQLFKHNQGMSFMSYQESRICCFNCSNKESSWITLATQSLNSRISTLCLTVWRCCHMDCLKFLCFFLLDAAWVRSRAERPSVSYTKVSAVSPGLANSCNYTSRNKFKQNSGSNKSLIAGDGKMKRMREP